MGRPASKVNLFHYLDYREYLRDWYQEAKAKHSGFSYRAFAKKAGFQSPNFLQLVIEGKRNLTQASLSKVAKGLGLNKQEGEFFENLVWFTQAKTHGEKDRRYRDLLQSRKFSTVKPMEKEQYEFYSTWYHPVVRELVLSKEFDGTPEWLSSKIHPAITPQQAAKSLELLEKLQFLKKGKNGKYQQTSSVVSTGAEVKSLTLMNYHQGLLELSRDLLAELPPPDRDISAMTLGVAKDRLPQLKREIQEFRQRILKMVSLDNQPDEVVQLNVQLFPLTRRKKESS